MVISQLKLIATYELPCDGGSRIAPNPGLWLEPLSARPRDAFVCSPSGIGRMIRQNSTQRQYSIPPIMDTTNSTIKRLHHHYRELNLSGFALEAWITPVGTIRNQSQSLPIITIGRGSWESVPVIGLDGCDGYSFRLSQIGQFLQLSYTDNDPARSCRVLPLEQEQMKPQLTQIFVSLGPSETSVFIDGRVVVTGVLNNMGFGLEPWDESYGIQLFSNYASLHLDPSRVFTGSIHKFSIYSGNMSARQFETTLGDVKPKPGRLVANAWFNSTTVQGGWSEDAVIWIGGLNSSTSTLTVFVEVVSTSIHGSLISPNNTEIVQGQLLDLQDGISRVPVRYKPSSMNYFNVPSITADGKSLALEPESVTYRLVGMDPMDFQVVSVSDPVSQPIYVIHRNHRPTLLAPAQATVATDQPSGIGARPKYFIHGLILLDVADQSIDRVRINVWAFNGTLTLNQAYLHLADFKSCADRYYSSWQCSGSGDHNRNMTFLAEPSNVELILRNLQYDAFYVNQKDAIVIQAFDGAGGECLDPKELTVFYDELGNSFQTFQTGCFATQADILVPVITGEAWAKMGHDKEEASLSHAITYVLFGAFLIFLCCTTSCTKRFVDYNRNKEKISDRTARG